MYHHQGEPTARHIPTIHVLRRGYIRPFIDDPIHHSQVLVCLKHECAIFSIRVVPNIELIHKFLSYGDTVTILTDCELRDEIVKNLKKSIRNYGLST